MEIDSLLFGWRVYDPGQTNPNSTHPWSHRVAVYLWLQNNQREDNEQTHEAALAAAQYQNNATRKLDGHLSPKEAGATRRRGDSHIHDECR